MNKDLDSVLHKIDRAASEGCVFIQDIFVIYDYDKFREAIRQLGYDYFKTMSSQDLKIQDVNFCLCKLKIAWFKPSASTYTEDPFVLSAEKALEKTRNYYNEG